MRQLLHTRSEGALHRTRREALTRRRMKKRGWRTVCMAVAVAMALQSFVSAFDFYPPFLPDCIAANETITHVELRIALSDTEAIGTQVRVRPTSSSIQFTPSEIVFSSTYPIVQALVMIAREPGVATIKFMAQVETLQDGSFKVSEVAKEVGSRQINVLAPPLAYAIEDARWHGVIIRNDSFDAADGTVSIATSPLWATIRHGYPSSACGAQDGSKALYFTALGDRLAMTKPLSLVGFDGKLHFQHLYGYRPNGQDYDTTGDNRVSCEMVDKGEEIVVSYLPANQTETNASAWRELLEAPVMADRGREFTAYTVVLPTAAMHEQARFKWQQKTHSSFPVDPISGLSLAAVIAGENDDTSIRGEMGVAERELWTFRNLFDQWALDDVRLEVRLQPPIFQHADDKTTQVFTFTTGSGDVEVSIGHASIVVGSPVQDTWTEFTVGDGTHAFPACDIANVAKANTAQTVRMEMSGYVHAIACLLFSRETSAIVSSFPTRSPRILVQAKTPTITTTVDTTTVVDTWTVRLACDGCSFMRYTIYSPATILIAVDVGERNDPASRIMPSCSFGTRVEGVIGSVRINANSRVFAVACGPALLQSDVAGTSLLKVAPRAPTFTFTYTPTTVTNNFEVMISPPTDTTLGIAYTVGEANTLDPVCPVRDEVSVGKRAVTVRASDVIRAVTCCSAVQCVDSLVSVWGPIKVQAVTPLFSMVCSRTKPLTMVLQITPVTVDAWVQYHVGKPSNPLNCIETTQSPFLSDDLEVAETSTSVFAVSCLHGLQPSDQVEIPVVVDHCCAGMDAFQRASCAHVLLLHDDFGTCLDMVKWQKLTTQWGGQDVNGGVHASNVQCLRDDARSKNVLQLAAHGDPFAGTSPVGSQRVDSDGSLQDRTIDDMFLEWALDGVSPTPCNEQDRCPARRVGAAIQTATLTANSGVMVIRLQPCQHFGTLTQVWWGDYANRDDETLQQVAFLPLWKAGLYQAKTTPEVSFVVSSPSSLPRQDGGVGGNGESPFIELALQWDASIGRSNLYLNGRLVHKQVLNTDAQSLATAPLSIGVWFPNAVAGEPLFATCDVVIDEVHIFKPEVTGDRWCDFEDVSQDAVPCVSDRDCHDWVHTNCLMPIHESVCIAHREEALQVDGDSFSSHAGEDDEEEVDRTESTSEGNAHAPATQLFCQFRLQPTTSQEDPTETLQSTTEMTQRIVGLQWPTEEGQSEPTTVALSGDNDDRD